MRKKVMGILFCMIMVFEIVAGNKGFITITHTLPPFLHKYEAATEIVNFITLII